MQSVPESLSTTAQPPLRIPLAHVLVGLGFLLVGSVVALSVLVEALPVFGRIAAAHLLLVGWVAVTIVGAMTQFVPVWSGVELYSRRLATLQLLLLSVGVGGFALVLSITRPDLTAWFALLMSTGFGVFCYNVGRTLWRARPWDVTERHFALAIVFFLAAAGLGTSLAIDFRFALFPLGSATRSTVLGAHVTLAVFGGVLLTVVGALYQLGPMFTQSQESVFDERLRAVESMLLPSGVALLAGGRLLGFSLVATLGGLGVAIGFAAAAIVLGRRLYFATVDYSPMLPRYAVATVSGLAWTLVAGASWVSDPLSSGTRFGPAEIGPILLFGTIGFVLVGTLYHVVPFLIWIHRYSDRLGYEPVPTVEDLSSARIERIDLLATVIGTVVVFGATGVSGLGGIQDSRILVLAGGLIIFVGLILFVSNMMVTVWRHAPGAADPRTWIIDG